MDEGFVGVYVLPSEEGQPPRAILMQSGEEPEIGSEVEGVLAQWSADTGVWMVGDIPLPQEFSAGITEHAKQLGMSW